MNSPLISVIMPALNAEQFIDVAIKSVLEQTYRKWELIVIDDGSTDQTYVIVKQYLTVDSRIKYFFQQNSKQGKARNNGIESSKGDYIAFLDADDIWTPHKLAIQVTEILSNKTVDLVFSQGFQIQNGLVQDYNVKVKECWDKSDLPDFIEGNQIPILSVLLRKEALLAVNSFSELDEVQNVEDYHLWLKLLMHNYTFKSLKERLFYYRIHPNQSTFQNANTTTQIFAVYQDLYYSNEDIRLKRALIKKLKWFIFDDKFHLKCLNISISHFEILGRSHLSVIIERFLSKNNRLSKRAIFRLIHIYG